MVEQLSMRKSSVTKIFGCYLWLSQVELWISKHTPNARYRRFSAFSLNLTHANFARFPDFVPREALAMALQPQPLTPTAGDAPMAAFLNGVRDRDYGATEHPPLRPRQ